MTQQEIDRIQNAIRHIQTAVDVDQWAVEIAVEAMWKQIPQKWIHRNDDYNDWLECPRCGYGSEGEVKYGENTNYCPNCGKKMEEE